MGTPLFLLLIMPSADTRCPVPPLARPVSERATPPTPHGLCPNGRTPRPHPRWRHPWRLVRHLHHLLVRKVRS